MALQINLPDSNVGLPVAEAYARIVFLSFDTKSGEVSVAVDIFANRAAREAGKAPVAGGVFKAIIGTEDMPSLDDSLPGGVRAALYGWLKRLPEFQGAIDV